MKRKRGVIMIEKSSFMEQYSSLEHSENFKAAVKYPLINEEEAKSGRDDSKFNQGLKLYAKWLKHAYITT